MKYSPAGSTKAFLLVALAATACSEGERDHLGAARTPSPAHVSYFGSGLSLEGFATESVVSTSDSIFIGYVIRNGGSAERLVLDPRFFEVQLHAGDSPPEILLPQMWTGSTGDEGVVTLPRFGIVGRVFALSCGNLGFTVLEACVLPHRELAPGMYGVVIVYSPPEPPGSRSQRTRLVSDTIRVTVVER